MTRKRAKKLFMAKGFSRDAADFICRNIKMYDENQRLYPNEVKVRCVQCMGKVERDRS